MSYTAQGLPLNPRTINTESFGSLEQNCCNDLNSSEFQTRRKIKFVSSIDHYYSSHCTGPPNFNFSPTLALTNNLVSANETKTSGDFQAFSNNLNFMNDKFQSCVNIPSPLAAINQPTTFYETNEIGFSSLFSLEYSMPDYGDTGLRNFEHFSDGRRNDSSFTNQFYFEQPMSNDQRNPYFAQAFVQENLSMHGQIHNVPREHPSASEQDYSCLSLVEPTCLTSNWKLSNYLPPRPSNESTVENSNFFKKPKSNFGKSRPSSKSIRNKLAEDEQLASNFNPKQSNSHVALQKCNLEYNWSSLSTESRSSYDLKKEIVNKSENSTSPKEVEMENLKAKKLNLVGWKENPTNDLICDMETSSPFPAKENVLKMSMTEFKTSDQHPNELLPKKIKNLSNPSVKEKDKNNFSESSTALSSQSNVLVESHRIAQAEPEVKPYRGTLPVECDSTTESSMQSTEFNDHTNSRFDKTNASIQNPSEKLESEMTNRANLDFHRETSAEQLLQPNKCRICKEFLVTDRPSSQQFTVPIDANYDVCNACNICFLQKSALSTNDGDEKNPHKCTYCERRFKKECYLVLHIRSHTTERPFKCNVCEKAFPNSSKLKLHVKTHTGDKPFVCKECDRRFVQDSHLKMHARIHFGNSFFKCSSCTKGFASRYKLSEHEKYHNPKLPFKCVTCEKSFVKKTYFESHLRIHCDAKPFECSTCNTFFAQKSVLRQHTKHCCSLTHSNELKV